MATVFGSFAGREHARDVNLAVYLAHSVDEIRALEYSEKLGKEIGREIGLPVDVIVLNDADEGLLMRAILKGRKILARDSIPYHRLRMLALEARDGFLPKRGTGESR